MEKDLVKKIIRISVILVFWIAVWFFLGREIGGVDFWGFMLIGVAIITFFGILGLPGNVDEKGIFRESRIRLSIMGTLIMVYLVYFGSIIYLDASYDPAGNLQETFASSLLPTLTNLIMVTISFYFGSSVAVEIANSRSKKNESKNKD